MDGRAMKRRRYHLRKDRRSGIFRLPEHTVRALREERLFNGPAPIDESLREKTLCFTGHRGIPEDDLPELTGKLDELLEAAFRKGYSRFLCGGALGFDTLAAQRVLVLQSRHPEVRLILALPCAGQADSWTEGEKRTYQRLKYAASEVHMLSDFYYRGCMHVRNRYMVDRSAFCFCYLRELQGGGTLFTVAYALRKGVPVLNLAMEDACRAFLKEENQSPGC